MDSREIAVALFDAFSMKDAAAAIRLFHENARHRVYSSSGDRPFAGTFEGLDAIRARFEAAFAHWEVRRLELREIAVDGGRVAMKVTVDAVEREGQRREIIEAMHFLTIEGGRIVEFDVFFEPAASTKPHQEHLHDNPIRRPS